VYVTVSESENNEPNAVLWKNGEKQKLSNVYSSGSSVFVSGNDVYVAGAESDRNGSAALWKNGVKQILSQDS